MSLTKRILAFSSCCWWVIAVVLGPLLSYLAGVKLASSRMKEAELYFVGGSSWPLLLPFMFRLQFSFVAPSICAFQLPLCPCLYPGPSNPKALQAFLVHRMQDSVCKKLSQLLSVLLFMASNILLQLFLCAGVCYKNRQTRSKLYCHFVFRRE